MLQDIPDGLERVEVRSASVGKPGVSKRQEEINYKWQTVFFSPDPNRNMQPTHRARSLLWHFLGF